ncbi:anti-sigma factor [Bacillus sp. FJAT-18017]|uniref:anti-sigma factor family protein n=1 Tax=Bacillus sp. FJAT-18017 TaxID=1705566 RepID=UPI0006B039FA|nr:anti-sigma factor [Bacillus sp. FJAT-18017]ALC92588.1 anti-sigma factor [Bacillus sp. FJAT-18017]
MKCPDQIIGYMHDYLDEDIEPEHEQLLKEHFGTCKDCQRLFHELEKSVALVKSTSHIQAPQGFTESVMAKLPREKRKVGIQRWMKGHPIVSAAAVFVVLMAGSLFSIAGNTDQEFSTTNADQVVIQNDTVIVPEGKVVKGDLVVKNGDIKIEGEVQGDVTVINGENYLASAGNVTGKIEKVDKTFDLIWYHIKKAATNLVGLGQNE